jgi:hypothetical protein
MTQTVDPEKSSGHVPRSFSVEDLLRQHRTDEPITSGALIDKLLGTHQPPYLGDGLIPEPVAALGPSRTVAGHVDVAQRRWDGEQIVEFHGRHLLLALAMDAGVGWPLLRSGVIAEILTNWRQPAPAPRRLVWDLLSQEGRDLAEEQPLLAAAFGAQPEWTAELPEPVTMLALSPAADRVAVLAGGTVYEVTRDGDPRRVNDVDGTVVSIGWGRRPGQRAVRPGGAGQAGRRRERRPGGRGCHRRAVITTGGPPRHGCRCDSSPGRGLSRAHAGRGDRAARQRVAAGPGASRRPDHSRLRPGQPRRCRPA